MASKNVKSLGDCEFESHHCHSHQWLGAKAGSLGGRSYMLPDPCQSRQPQPIMGVLELMYAEEGTRSEIGVQ